MLGLDTNVLVRLLVGHDDPEQTRRAREMVTQRCTPENPAYINVIVLCETVWVLSAKMGYGRAAVLTFLEKILNQRVLRVEDGDLALLALEDCHNRAADFADAFMGLRNKRAGCATTLTFDRGAAKLPMFEAV